MRFIEVGAGANEKLLISNQDLEKMSYIDGLTKISNRRQFDKRLEEGFGRSLRHRLNLTLVLIDIDFFKLYNDHYGHYEGDQCLKQVAQLIDGNCRRSTDFAARYGGEEFAVVLFNEDAESAKHICRNIRKDLKALSIPHKQSPVCECVTLSMGIASIVPTAECSISGLIEAADQALYLAKSNGRNCAMVSAGQ